MSVTTPKTTATPLSARRRTQEKHGGNFLLPTGPPVR